MKKCLILAFLIVNSLIGVVRAEGSIDWIYKQTRVIGGYSLNMVNGDTKHIFDFGIKETKTILLLLPVEASTYFASDIYYSKGRITVGQKIGQSFSFWFFLCGYEGAFYTNFSGGNSIVYTPYCGFDFFGTIISLNVPITLYRSSNNYLNIVSLHIGIPLKTLEYRSYLTTGIPKF